MHFGAGKRNGNDFKSLIQGAVDIPGKIVTIICSRIARRLKPHLPLNRGVLQILGETAAFARNLARVLKGQGEAKRLGMPHARRTVHGRPQQHLVKQLLIIFQRCLGHLCTGVIGADHLQSGA